MRSERPKVGRYFPVPAGILAQVGALAAAILSSACCWLPLLLIALGASGSSLSRKFAAWCPVFLPVTFVFLGLAFYLTYRKPRQKRAAEATAACGAAAGACCQPTKGGNLFRRINRVMLWVVAVWALAFAFFPNYVAYLWDGSPQATSPAGGSPSSSAERIRWTLSIAGMTCEGCAAHLEAELAKVPGVLSVSVSYKSGRAVVEADPSVTEEALHKAVEGAGYTVESAAKSSGG